MHEKERDFIFFYYFHATLGSVVTAILLLSFWTIEEAQAKFCGSRKDVRVS